MIYVYNSSNKCAFLKKNFASKYVFTFFKYFHNIYFNKLNLVLNLVESRKVGKCPMNGLEL